MSLRSACRSRSLDYGLGSRDPRGRRLWRFTPELHTLPAACEPRPTPETQLLPRCFRTQTDLKGDTLVAVDFSVNTAFIQSADVNERFPLKKAAYLFRS